MTSDIGAIDHFEGEHFFLSNFYEHPFKLRMVGIFYATAEHAYQAQKTNHNEQRAWIAEAPTAKEAKRRGRGADLRPDWEQTKFEVMRDVVRSKFCSTPAMMLALLGTAPHMLIEGNTWHDQEWGDCRCPKHRDTPGLNALGTVLMDLRLDFLAAKARGDLDSILPQAGAIR